MVHGPAKPGSAPVAGRRRAPGSAVGGRAAVGGVEVDVEVAVGVDRHGIGGQARAVGRELSPVARAASKIMQQLYTAFMNAGCSLAEINPLVVTPQGEVIAVDGKMVIDDNELDRHPELETLRD